MTTKTAEAETVARPAGRAAPAPGRSVLAADIRLNGDLNASGTIEVLGEVSGDITAQTLIVGSEGKVNGTVRAEAVDVRGRLEGKVTCATFTLRSAAQVFADVLYDSLVIESGAQIEGNFSRNPR